MKTAPVFFFSVLLLWCSKSAHWPSQVIYGIDRVRPPNAREEEEAEEDPHWKPRYKEARNDPVGVFISTRNVSLVSFFSLSLKVCTSGLSFLTPLFAFFPSFSLVARSFIRRACISANAYWSEPAVCFLQPVDSNFLSGSAARTNVRPALASLVSFKIVVFFFFWNETAFKAYSPGGATGEWAKERQEIGKLCSSRVISSWEVRQHVLLRFALCFSFLYTGNLLFPSYFWAISKPTLWRGRKLELTFQGCLRSFL